MISYYALYRRDASQGPPVGLFIVEERTGDALLWDHQAKAWVYDPDLVERVLEDPDNWERYRPVSREAAEAATMVVTRAAEALPDEETIQWLFRWKGRPPTNPDLSDELA